LMHLQVMNTMKWSIKIVDYLKEIQYYLPLGLLLIVTFYPEVYDIHPLAMKTKYNMSCVMICGSHITLIQTVEIQQALCVTYIAIRGTKSIFLLFSLSFWQKKFLTFYSCNSMLVVWKLFIYCLITQLIKFKSSLTWII
jgi:hypothetical protein